jgi:lysophospholipase L1-like esterase
VNPGILVGISAAAAWLVLLAPPAAAHHERAAACKASAELARLQRPLLETAAAIKRDKRLLIVAIGSSSTAGYGATDAAHTYPARLASELKLRWPAVEVSIVNKGVGGETAVQMLARFEDDVVALKPQLVLWQVGSNSVLRGGGIAAFEDALRRGVERIRAAHADVVLIDPQYAPRILSRPLYIDVLRTLADVVADLKVARFQRFGLMKQWVSSGQVGSEVLLSPDQLHMSDVGYACVARNLASAIEAATGIEQIGASVRR